MSMEYIRKMYGVPCRRGAKVVYTGDESSRVGVVTSAKDMYINIRFEGSCHTAGPFHPTWHITWLGVDKQPEEEVCSCCRAPHGEEHKMSCSNLWVCLECGQPSLGKFCSQACAYSCTAAGDD